MKYIQSKLNLLALTIVIFFSGCNDEFIEPKYTPEFPWQTLEQLEMAVILPYSTCLAGWDKPMGVYGLYEMLATDICTLIPGQAGNFPWNEFYNRKMRETPLEAPSMKWLKLSYQSLFNTIAGCNEPLEWLNSTDPKLLFSKELPVNVEAVVPRVKAELYFFRGFAYYWAALFFCPPYVPGGENANQILPLKTTNVDAQNTKIGTTKEIWEQVISDLKMAKSLMPVSYNVEGRINYHTICGALARAYLSVGDHANAEKECTEIISSEKYGLQGDVMAAWNTLPGDPIAHEVIWTFVPGIKSSNMFSYSAVSRAEIDGENGSRGDAYGQCAWIMVVMSDNMLKRIDWMNDPGKGDFSLTAQASGDKRLGNTWFHLLGYKTQEETGLTDKAEYMNTFESKIPFLVNPHVYPDKYFRGSDNKMTRIPLMRVAEFYLMRAAIRFENRDNTGAAADVNVIRKRAGLPDLASAAITAAVIDREYVIEMGGEGLYLPYLMGMQRPILPGDRVGVPAVNPPYSGWYFRIPEDEVWLNAGYNGLPNPNYQ